MAEVDFKNLDEELFQEFFLRFSENTFLNKVKIILKSIKVAAEMSWTSWTFWFMNVHESSRAFQEPPSEDQNRLWDVFGPFYCLVSVWFWPDVSVFVCPPALHQRLREKSSAACRGGSSQQNQVPVLTLIQFRLMDQWNVFSDQQEFLSVLTKGMWTSYESVFVWFCWTLKAWYPEPRWYRIIWFPSSLSSSGSVWRRLRDGLQPAEPFGPAAVLFHRTQDPGPFVAERPSSVCLTVPEL